jgi:hypothetical protein
MKTLARIRRCAFVFAAASGITLWAVPGAARAEYPGKMREAFNMPCSSGCLLCHSDPSGGPGNFNKWIEGRLAFPSSPDPVAALAAIEVKDFDGDGVTDEAELRAGTDPGAFGAMSVCLPEYGCGAHVAKSPPRDVRGPFALLLAGLAVAGLLRRQRPVRQ